MADQSAFLEKWRDVFPIDIRLSRGFNKSVALARQAGHKQMRDHVAVFKYPWEIYDMERHVFLRVIDWNWLKHLNRLEKIKQSAMFASYEQKDITVAYRELAYKAFGEMLDDIEYETIKLLFRTRPYVDYTPIQKENADAVN